MIVHPKRTCHYQMRDQQGLCVFYRRHIFMNLFHFLFVKEEQFLCLGPPHMCFFFSIILVSLMQNHVDHIPNLKEKIEKKLGFHELQTINLKNKDYKYLDHIPNLLEQMSRKLGFLELETTNLKSRVHIFRHRNTNQGL